MGWELKERILKCLTFEVNTLWQSASLIGWLIKLCHAFLGRHFMKFYKRIKKSLKGDFCLARPLLKYSLLFVNTLCNVFSHSDETIYTVRMPRWLCEENRYGLKVFFFRWECRPSHVRVKKKFHYRTPYNIVLLLSNQQPNTKKYLFAHTSDFFSLLIQNSS